MRLVGMNPVVVHGGGPQISDLMRRLGKEPEFVDGLRVTDAETVDIVRMALVGKVNREIVASVNRHGSYAVGLSGEDAGLITVGQRDDKLGFVGDIRRIDPSILERLLREELIPVVATVGVDEAGQAYNVNADTVAGAIAESLRAEKLVYLTNVAGMYSDLADEASLISRIDVDRLAALVDAGALSEGMIPKVAFVRRRREVGCEPGPHPRRAHPARAPARVLHPRGDRHDGDRMTTAPTTRFDEIVTLDAEHVMGTYARAAGRVRARRRTRLWDSEGREYLDFLSGLAVTSLGHAHPAVADAIADQARTLTARLQPLLQRAPAPVGRPARRAPRWGRARVLLELGRGGERVRDQAGPPLRPDARRQGALSRRLHVRLLPRPDAHDVGGDRATPEAGDVPTAPVRVPAGAVRRRGRARRRARRARVRRPARGRAGRGRREPGASRLSRSRPLVV